LVVLRQVDFQGNQFVAEYPRKKLREFISIARQLAML